MERKKILVVSKSFHPENSPRSFRTTELVKEFCRQGHDVTLYTLKNQEHQASIEKEFGVKIMDLGKLFFTPFNLNKGGRAVILFKRVLNRLLLQLIEYPDIELMFKVRRALKKESGYDLLVSVAVPHPVHWGVAWARSKKHPIAKTWVADCGDAFMGVVKHDSFNKFFYFKYFEKNFCRKANYISIPKIVMKVNFYPEFHDKMREIPQGFKFDDVKIDRQPVKNTVPTFAFAGVFMRTTRNPSPLLDYLVRKEYDFKFIVYTSTPGILEPYREALKEKLEIREYIPRLELLTELSKMDFLLNIGYDPAQQSPSKLIDYYLTERPILNLNTNNVDEKTVDGFFRGDYSGAFKTDNLDQYRIENVCSSFLRLVSAE